MSNPQNPLLTEFEQSMVDCRQLYLTCGRECADNYPHLVKKSRREFLEWMDDLHNGLLLKIYCDVALADRVWAPEEREFARSLFIHVWNRDIQGAELRETTKGLSERSAKLKWYSLIRPFAEIAPLRNHVGELETIVIRIANLVAKADGELADSEARVLKSIQHELDRHLRRIQLDDSNPNQEERRVKSNRAVQTLGEDAHDVREQCELVDEHPDVLEDEESAEEKLAKALEELDALIGLESVKSEVRTLTNFLQVQKQREDAGLPKTDLSLHMVFAGNPGTGKTTVARIVGKIFGAMGVVQSGHLVETDRSGLVAEYAGQTGPKTNKKIDEALDGILFIDEAYSLVADESDDAFGREALQTLLKRMEDDRHRLVVILAGYPEPMERLVRANPGLSSRFSRTLTFEDYQSPDLGRIFELLCQSNHYRISSPVRRDLLLGFDWLYTNRDEHFGNGRLVRNIFEDSIRNLANRISTVAPITTELLTRIQPQDVQFPISDPHWHQQSKEEIRFRVECPGCEKISQVIEKALGRRVKCRDCEETFLVDWAKPV